MRTSTTVVVALLAVLTAVSADTQKPLPESADKETQEFKEELKKELPKLKDAFAALQAAPEPSAIGPLPTPSLTEPFEIGEALYDQGRVADAVVSLLALMQIGVVPDANASTRATTGITLSESEVRALIDLAGDDLEQAENEMENLPHTFADLHAAVADLLPGVSVEQLAEAYTRAYAARPEELIAKALMGQPIEPETKLTRAQIWFLLMDGFAGAAATGGRWGTADREVPDLKSPNTEWSAVEVREVLARLPLVTASRLVTISAPGVISPGTTAGGPPVNVTARVAASVPPLVSRATGRTLLAPRAGSLAGHDVTWRVHDDSVLPEIGTIVSPVDDPTRVGADGLARFIFQPGADPTRGAGQLVDDWEPLEARFETRGLVANAYTVPASLAPLTFGTSRANANVHLRWRSPDVLHLYVINRYFDINFQIAALGGGTRNGKDHVIAILYKRPNGSYVGRGDAKVDLTQTLRGSPSCGKGSVNVSQKVRVVAEPQSGFGPTHSLEHFDWLDAQLNEVGTMANSRPDGGYYRLIFYPMEDPPAGGWCIPNIPAGRDRQGWGGSYFIPFNDAQWTTSGYATGRAGEMSTLQGYGIALKARGTTAFFDRSSLNPLAGTPLAGLRDRGLQLTGKSRWLVVVARSYAELAPYLTIKK